MFLARGFPARDNTSACTRPIIYLLKCAKENKACEYNLGVILARSLNNAVSRNVSDGTPIYAGAITTFIYKYIKNERRYDDNIGTLVEKSTLLDFALLSNLGVSVPYGGFHLYTSLTGALESGS